MEIIRREMEAQLLATFHPPDGVHWESGECGGVRGKWVFPPGNSDKVLLYFHGGGFTLGSSGIPLPFLCQLAHRLRLNCFSADYALAPERPFPASVEDCLAAYEGLLVGGYRPGRIALGGESAGGTLSLSLIHQLKEAGRPLPKAVLSISPVADALPKEPGPEQTGKVLEALPGTEEIMKIYAPGADLNDPRISPVYGDFSGFPSLFVIAGGAEILRDDSLALAQACAKAGGDVKLLIGRDMIHTYPLDFKDYPEAAEALDEIVVFLSNKLIKEM